MLTPQTQKLVLDVSANFKDFNTQFNNLSKILKNKFAGIADEAGLKLAEGNKGIVDTLQILKDTLPEVNLPFVAELEQLIAHFEKLQVVIKETEINAGAGNEKGATKSAAEATTLMGQITKIANALENSKGGTSFEKLDFEKFTALDNSLGVLNTTVKELVNALKSGKGISTPPPENKLKQTPYKNGIIVEEVKGDNLSRGANNLTTRSGGVNKFTPETTVIQSEWSESYEAVQKKVEKKDSPQWMQPIIGAINALDKAIDSFILEIVGIIIILTILFKIISIL
jgi:hypothetical protein